MTTTLKSFDEEDKIGLINIYDLWAKRKINEAENAKLRAEIAEFNADLVRQGKIDLLYVVQPSLCW